MYTYKITFGNATQMFIKATSPKQAWEHAEKIGIVSHIKCVTRK